MSDIQHKEWFITPLVPHIQYPLMQQKIATQSEALEIAVKLEASPVGETDVGMNQIQAQLVNLTLQLQDIKKVKYEHEHLWCTRCHVDGHTKDTCPSFQNYLLSRVLNPLSYGSVPWCLICQVYGNQHEDCTYMQKMVTKPASLYCTFCRSAGHEDKDWLLQEWTYDVYFVKGEDPRMVQ